MNDDNAWRLVAATARQRKTAAERIVDRVWLMLRPQCIGLLTEFLGERLSPSSFFRFELALIGLLRELGRLLMQSTLQVLEGERPDQLPGDLWYECSGYIAKCLHQSAIHNRQSAFLR